MSALQNAGSIVEYSSPNSLSPTSALSVGEWSANLPLSGYERIVRHWFTTRVKAEGANSIDGRLIYVFPSLVLLSAVEISSTGLP